MQVNVSVAFLALLPALCLASGDAALSAENIAKLGKAAAGSARQGPPFVSEPGQALLHSLLASGKEMHLGKGWSPKSIRHATRSRAAILLQDMSRLLRRRSGQRHQGMEQLTCLQ